MLFFQRISCIFSSLAISMAITGCVVPRIPSDRYLEYEFSPEFHASEPCSSQSSWCDWDEKTEPPEEIPWPMFHPIPTRPVFGGSGL